MFFLWLLCGSLAAAVVVLWIKICLMRKSMEEIGAGVEECLSGDTNVLISVSSGDRAVKDLAARLNRQLRLLREQRRQYETGNQELKEAVTNISHDLRTPLTAICGYLDLLKGEEQSEKTARYLACVEERTEAMKALTEELFRYSVVVSTLEPLELEPVDLNRTLEECAAGFYAAFTSAGIQPVISLPEARCVRQANQSALCRVFSNILNNALKYSDGDLEITLLDSGEVRFTNSARRLDQVQVGKLFHRFYTVEAAGHSTGLGLAIAKDLMEEMGGGISAEYEAGRLTIRVVLLEDKNQ